jgi:hypothetical protein
MLSTLKACRKCHKEKPLTAFQKDALCTGGFRHQCRECANEYTRQWNSKNKEKVRATGRKSRHKRKTSDPIRASLKEILNGARWRARKFSVPFALTVSDLDPPVLCPVLGMPIDYGRKQRLGPGDDSPSIDRIVPALGYVAGNVRIMSFRANRIRNNATLDDLRKLVLYLESQDTTP